MRFVIYSETDTGQQSLRLEKIVRTFIESARHLHQQHNSADNET